MSRGPDRRMMGEPEVVIGRDRDRLAPVKAGDRAAAVQLPDRPPAVSRGYLRPFGPCPVIPAHPHECAIPLSPMWYVAGSSGVERVDDVGVLGVHDAAFEFEGGGEFLGLGGPFHG